MNRYAPLLTLLLLVVAACGDAAASQAGATVAPASVAANTTTASTPPARGAPVGGSSTTVSPPLAPAYPTLRSDVVDRWVPEVLATYPHDPGAFTQGLLMHDGVLYESTGSYGQSSVRRVDLATGRVLASARLGDEYFGEGLAIVDGELVQLTWQEQVAFTWDPVSLAPGAGYRYVGEGWGLCDTGTRLVMSDGSGTLQFRDRTSFELIGAVAVTLNGASVELLNELECVGGLVLANVWKSTDILVIDPVTGEVTAVIDASGLPSPAEEDAAAVLNGIAYDEVRHVFYVTGKLWPNLYEVVFVAE